MAPNRYRFLAAPRKRLHPLRDSPNRILVPIAPLAVLTKHLVSGFRSRICSLRSSQPDKVTVECPPDRGSVATTAAESHSASLEAELTASASCPQCGAGVVLHRTLNPHIDSSGFENYFLKCHQCGVWLIGIIDPYDEALLLTALKDEGKT